MRANAPSLLVEAALRYADDGQPVFPVVPGQKFPFTEHGFNDATTDAGLIRRWWRRWPAANIGLPTGVIYDVVDVDHKPHTSGFPTLIRLQKLGLLEGWTRLIRTPSGGAHIYFPVDPSGPQPCWQDAKHAIDFRGNGGYVLAAPSQVTQPSGRAEGYDVINAAGRNPAPVNAAAIRAVLQPARPLAQEGPERQPGRQWGPGEGVGGIERWLARRGVGERNASLFWASCRLAEHGLGMDETRAALGPIAQQIGLGQRESDATIASAYRRAHPLARSPGGTPSLRVESVETSLDR